MPKNISFKEAAITMELRLKDFYRKMAGKVSNPRSKEVLEFLSAEELKHTEVLNELTEVNVNTDQLNEAYDASGPILPVLRNNIMDNVAKIIKVAIDCEKDSHLFYRELAELVSNAELRGQVLRLANMERQHMKQLAVLFNVLSKE